MYSRSNSLTLTMSKGNLNQEQFPNRTMLRSREPEIFTFERIPDQTQHTSSSLRPRKRNMRVMYPAKVRKYLPPAEKSPAKRWLLALCLVVFLQIYTEEPCVETAVATESPAAEAAFEEAPFTQYQVLAFQSAEEHIRQLKANCQHESESQSESLLVNTTCPSQEAVLNLKHDQSTRNGYVVALLYPAVYHRLGGEQ
ncbi:radiation-inducible immediate-early gene IEX-1 [Osmerus mordax]|uniref:radiation-inducible immediate-early gene IEX-1 n=1 Tax=Osmerus mordax TaxID=8014 RepID=UPI00350F84F5